MLEDLAESYADIRVERTDRADVVVGQVLELRPGPDPAVRLPALLIIDVIAEAAEIPRGPPFLKAPFADLPFSCIPQTGQT